MKPSRFSGPKLISMPGWFLGLLVQADTGKPSSTKILAGGRASCPKPRNPIFLSSGLTWDIGSHTLLFCCFLYCSSLRCKLRTWSTTYSVIIGSPVSGSSLVRGTFGILGWLIQESTPACLVIMKPKLGRSGNSSKFGRPKAKYLISFGSLISGQKRTSRSGNSFAITFFQSDSVPVIISTISNVISI